MPRFSTCCVPACGRKTIGAVHADFDEFVCDAHYAEAAPARRERLATAQRRLDKLRARWDDDHYFGEILARGRYLKFCALLEWAQENVDRAWSRVMLDVLGAEARGQDAPQKIRVAS